MHKLIHYNMGTNTSIGIGIGIPFKNNALGGDRPYLPPELKARLIGVWDNYGKKNTDAKRGYIDEQVSLQKTGTSVNPLENFNISYEGMSGYNGYPVVFTLILVSLFLVMVTFLMVT